MSRWPIATIALTAITVATNALQIARPGLLALLERTPRAVAQHEWWRLVTALFAHAGGGLALAGNLVVLIVIGVVAERRFNRGLWLAIYFVCGVTGELAGLA